MVPAQLEDSEGGTPRSYEELLDVLSRCFAECFRVLKPGRVCAVNVATTIVEGTFYPLPFHLVPLMEQLGWRMKEDLIWRRWRGWDRRGGVVIQKPYPGYFYPNRIFEYVLLFTKPGGPPTYAGRTEQERQDSRIPVNDLLFHELNNNIWNILPVPPQRRAKGADGIVHPCPYPEELAYRLITLYSYKGDIVLDPFTGSGTTPKVANLTGRRWVGYEVNPAFRSLARERIRAETTIQRQRRITRFETLPSSPQEGGQDKPALSVKQTR
jgi:site-specific DNA-methyltransferase (adenine-specific)